jgi:hypothetical protein
MTRRARWIMTIATATLAVGAVGAGVAAATSNDTEQPITGQALDQASAAALAYTGGGRVTETEVGDEESYYEVEVTLPDGRQVDVQLDEHFVVVGSEVDQHPDDASGNDGGQG